MAAEQIVDVRYRGLEVGTRLRLFEFGPTTAYLETAQPMPVGTVLSIEAEGGLVFEATVLRVQEQVAGAEHPPGMCVRAAVEGAVADWWKGNVAGADPTYPEPAIEVVAPPEPAPELAANEASGPSDGVPREGASDNSARATAVMDVSEIQAVIAAGGDVADLLGDGDDPDARPTMEMPAVDVKAIEAAAEAEEAAKAKAAADEAESKPNGKKKRRRRKRKTKA